MPAVIIDTNVLAVANGKAEQAGVDCVMSCISALESARRESVMIVDSGYRIFDEYRRHASLSGQPGLGDMFLKWLWNNQANQTHCKQVEITPSSTNPDDFEEFPADIRLASFDRSDRKFVAVALASHESPTVLNATDSDWWNFRTPLEENGVYPQFICPALFL